MKLIVFHSSLHSYHAERGSFSARKKIHAFSFHTFRNVNLGAILAQKILSFSLRLASHYMKLNQSRKDVKMNGFSGITLCNNVDHKDQGQKSFPHPLIILPNMETASHRVKEDVQQPFCRLHSAASRSCYLASPASLLLLVGSLRATTAIGGNHGCGRGEEAKPKKDDTNLCTSV